MYQEGAYLGHLVAAADLTTKQFHLVKEDSNGDVVLCSVAGELATGILDNAPDVGRACRIAKEYGSVFNVVAGAAFARGALLRTNASARAVATASGSYVLMKARQAATANGDVVEVEWIPASVPSA